MLLRNAKKLTFEISRLKITSHYLNLKRYPLHAASEKGQVEVVKKLIQAGGDVNEQTEYGSTALHAASENGHLEVITALLTAGADTTIKSNSGRTPHDVAKNQDSKSALK